MCIQVSILKFPENGFAGVGEYKPAKCQPIVQDLCIQVPILKFPENGFAGVGEYWPANLLFSTCVFKYQSSSSQITDLLEWVNINLLTYCPGNLYSSANPKVPREWICWGGWMLNS